RCHQRVHGYWFRVVAHSRPTMNERSPSGLRSRLDGHPVGYRRKPAGPGGDPSMWRRTLIVVTGASLLLFGASSGAARAQPRGAGCMLQGLFKTVPTLKSDPEKIRYTITGTASDCHWSDSGSTESGRFTATGRGVASCSYGTTRGIAHIRWNTGRRSTMTFTTTNVFDGVELEGTFTRGESKGYEAHAVLLFVVDTNEPVGCITEFGLHDATFHGFCE